MNYWALFLAGITDSYNPCSIGVLLISLTILIGLKKKKLILTFGIVYLSTIFVTYFLIGVGILKAFHLFGIHGFFGYTAGIILIITGFAHLLPRFFSKVPILGWINRCHIPTNIDKRLEKGVFIAGIVLGFLIGVCTVPCAGGIYLGAIALLATSANYWKGLLGILLFNIGFIIPLLLIFIISSRKKFLDMLQKLNSRFASYSNYAISTVMIIMGIILLILAMG